MQQFLSQGYTLGKWKYILIITNNLLITIYNSIIHDSHKMETTQIFINYWMDKLKWYIYTIGCYTTIKRNQVMIHATTYMNIMVKEIKSQKRQDTIWFH